MFFSRILGVVLRSFKMVIPTRRIYSKAWEDRVHSLPYFFTVIETGKSRTDTLSPSQ